MRRALTLVALALVILLLAACDGEEVTTFESPVSPLESPLPAEFTWEGFTCQTQEDGAVRCEQHQGDGRTLVCWYWPAQGGEPVCFYNQEQY